MAAVQALRATYPVCCRLAAIDRVHDAEALTRDVSRLPEPLSAAAGRQRGALDLFDPPQLAARGARPGPGAAARGARLQRAARPGGRSASSRSSAPASAPSPASSGAARSFATRSAPPATAPSPARCATLPGGAHYSLRCEHSELPRSERGRRGIDRSAAQRPHPAPARGCRRAPGPLRLRHRCALCAASSAARSTGTRSASAERRRYLNRLNAPPPATGRAHARVALALNSCKISYARLDMHCAARARIARFQLRPTSTDAPETDPNPLPSYATWRRAGI